MDEGTSPAVHIKTIAKMLGTKYGAKASLRRVFRGWDGDRSGALWRGAETVVRFAVLH